MNKANFKTLILTIHILMVFCHSSPLNGFNEIDESKIDWIDAFRTEYQWRVKFTNNEFILIKQDRTTGYRDPDEKNMYFSPKIQIGNATIFGTNVSLKIPNGYLLGVSHDWSGGLFLFNDSLNSYKQIELKDKYERINSIIRAC